MKKASVSSGQVFTTEQLHRHGRGDTLLVAISGKVYDVTSGKQHYGPGGPYHSLAGSDITRSMCKFEMNPSKEALDRTKLTKGELECLKNWEEFYADKYPCVGVYHGPYLSTNQVAKTRLCRLL